MKDFRSLAALSAAFILPLCISCSDLMQHPGDEIGTLIVDLPPMTRSSYIPLTEDFELNVSDATGRIIYDGKYSSSPEKFELNAGSYTVSAQSCQFDEPRYDCPQFGDSKVVAVKAGQTANVLLECRQLNCGLRIEADAAFRSAYPSSDLLLKSLSGSLIWTYGENRTAFFRPGSVSVVLGSQGETLCSRTLAAQQMLTLKLSATGELNGEPGTGDGIRLLVDTTRTWLDDSYVIGGSNPGSSPAVPYTITQARQHSGESDVWVCGYIVGIATSTSRFQFEGPFARNTNIVIGLRPGTIDPEFCMSVELAKGDVRDALNLMDNPTNLGKRVCVRGSIADAYYGIPGIKGLDDYLF